MKGWGVEMLRGRRDCGSTMEIGSVFVFVLTMRKQNLLLPHYFTYTSVLLLIRHGLANKKTTRRCVLFGLLQFSTLLYSYTQHTKILANKVSVKLINYRNLFCFPFKHFELLPPVLSPR